MTSLAHASVPAIETRTTGIPANRLQDWAWEELAESEAWTSYLLAHRDMRRDQLRFWVTDEVDDYAIKASATARGVKATPWLPSAWFAGRTPGQVTTCCVRTGSASSPTWPSGSGGRRRHPFRRGILRRRTLTGAHPR